MSFQQPQQMIFLLCLAGFFAAAVYAVCRTFVGGQEGRQLRERLGGDPSTAAQRAFGSSAKGSSVIAGRSESTATGMSGTVQKLGQAAAAPFMPSNRETQSQLRRRLGQAGIYAPSAMRVMIGFRFILLVGGLVAGYFGSLFFDDMLMTTALLSCGGLVGYLAPTIWLKMRIKKNQLALTLGLPDALDLMVVCVEAGLTVDAAMQRVGQELSLAHVALSRELGIAHMETRVGLSRMESLRNLGQRTGNAALQSLAAMLIQADRFGTSVANALRIHADSLRVARQNAAEEMAAKASVKMSFPIVLFIFPATFIVLAGPTVIDLMKNMNQ